MNIFRYFEGPAIRDARQHTDDLERLVKMAKREQQIAEERLRKKLMEARMPLAGALVWNGDCDE